MKPLKNEHTEKVPVGDAKKENTGDLTSIDTTLVLETAPSSSRVCLCVQYRNKTRAGTQTRLECKQLHEMPAIHTLIRDAKTMSVCVKIFRLARLTVLSNVAGGKTWINGMVHTTQQS